MAEANQKSTGNGVDQKPAPAGLKPTDKSLPRNRAEAPASARQDGLMAVGKSTRLEGRIEECELCLVAGSVKGRIVAGRLEIDAGGRVEGEAVVEDAVIAGVFDGQLTVTGALQLKSGARVTGEISYGEIQIETGARLVGRIDTDGVTYEPSVNGSKSLLGLPRKRG
jgi:cytoskeletal protein CcmA (bactofilin family)